MRLLKYILRWWSERRAVRCERLKIVMYTRNGCHLCDEALAVLASEQKRRGFEIETVDIDGDATLKEKYGECVPVVAIDGKVYFRGRVNAVLLRRLVVARLGSVPDE
jgi:glutaredoxin